MDPRTPGRNRRRPPYWVSFGLVIVLLTGITALFALFVLPQRFVLHAGLRESGISFPAGVPGFAGVPAGEVVRPPPRRPPTLPPAEGPAERLWREVMPLLRAGRDAEALPLFRHYLAERPGDTDVWREYALALARTGRLDEAEEASRSLTAAHDRLAVRLGLARALRDRGEGERAIGLYRELGRAHPANRGLCRELAQTLAWAGRHGEAADILAALLREGPDDPELRLELARVLYWAGRLEEARRVLAGIPPDSRQAAEASALDRRLADLLAPPPPEPVDESPLAGARRAAEEDDLGTAGRLYREAVEAAPDDREAWLEWIDFLQLRAGDLEGARDALARYGERFGRTPELSFRLAQLEAWTGRTGDARARLEALVLEDPSRPEAWVLLGDLRRWDGDRHGAATAYRRALAAEPESGAAREGLARVREGSEAAVAAREPAGAGPVAEGFLDSDDYRRFDLAGESRFRWGLTTLRATAGIRALRGLDAGGLKRTQEGIFGEVEVSRWWREATIRTALSAGLEHLDAFDLEPSFGALLEVPPASGTGLLARYAHGPAYPLTRTLESVLEPVRADQLAVSLTRTLGTRWSLEVAGDVTLLTQPGEDNARWVGSLFVARRLAEAWSAGLGTRFLAFDRPAAVGLRRLYWDPNAFWATDLTLALRPPVREGWGWHASLSPGIAVIDERDEPGMDVVPQVRTETGLIFLGERTTLSADLFYGRGRGRDYSSFGFELRLQVRP